MDNQVRLKNSAFGGYQKKSVHSYIFELNESAQEMKQKLSDHIDELTRERDMAVSECRSMEEKLVSAQQSLGMINESLAGEARKNEGASAMMEKLNAEIARQQESLAQKNAEIAQMSSRSADTEKLTRELDTKRRELELVAAQLNTMMNKARGDADAVINEARGQANDILREAHAKAESMLSDARGESERIRAYALTQADEIRGEAQRCAQAAANTAAADYRQLESVYAEVSAAKRALSDAATAINTKMAELDRVVSPKAQESASDHGERSNVSNFSVEAPREPTREASLADHILSQYGIRKDESGFFRLTSDK